MENPKIERRAALLLIAQAANAASLMFAIPQDREDYLRSLRAAQNCLIKADVLAVDKLLEDNRPVVNLIAGVITF